jgi:hypothetical protein
MASFVDNLASKVVPNPFKDDTDYVKNTNEVTFPSYNFAEELATPQELQIGRGGGWDSIGDAVAGTNYYLDAIAFGDSTGFARMWGNRQFRDKQRPLGVQFFTKTGKVCSNGADMYAYISTIPKGDALGKRVKEESEKMGLPPMKGLGPGILEDARDALNPLPLFSSILESQHAKCKKMTARVGDSKGSLVAKDGTPWITTPTQKDRQGFPTQERWVLDSWISEKEWSKTPKTEGKKTEGFQGSLNTSQLVAGALIVLLGVGIYSTIACKRK